MSVNIKDLENLRKIETEMLAKIKPELREFKKLEEKIKDEIVIKNFEMQNKINNVKKYEISLKIDFENVDKDEEVVSPEMQEILKKNMIDKIEKVGQEEEDKLQGELQKAKEETNEKIAQMIQENKEQLEERLNTEKEKLSAIKKEIKTTNKDISEIERVIKKAAPRAESRAFKILDQEQRQMIESRRELLEKEKTAKKSVDAAQTELSIFDEKYGGIKFKDDEGINTLLTMIYGRLADFSILMQEEEYEEMKRKEIEERKNTKEETKPAQEQKTLPKQTEETMKFIEPEDEEVAKTNTKEGQGKEENTKTSPEQGPEVKTTTQPAQGKETKIATQPVQDQRTKTTTQQAQDQGTKKTTTQSAQGQGTKITTQPTQSQGTKPVAQPIQGERTRPRLTYSAKEDKYVIQDNLDGLVILKRNDPEYKITKSEIAEMMNVDEADLKYVDTDAVVAWMLYDMRYHQKEAVKYLNNIINPNLSNDKDQIVEYNLTKIYGNKNISKQEKKQMIDYANYAQAFQIANVKRGIKGTISQKMEGLKDILNINRIFNKGKAEEEKQTVNTQSIRKKVKTNRFREETRINSEYNNISQEISEANGEDLQKLVNRAREGLKNKKISTTEYNGIIYNVNFRENNLKRPKEGKEKQPKIAAVRAQQGERE